VQSFANSEQSTANAPPDVNPIRARRIDSPNILNQAAKIGTHNKQVD
jgi:hypothetical protein